MSEQHNDWDELESMIEAFVLIHLPTHKQRQAFIPIRDFVFDRTTEGARVIDADDSRSKLPATLTSLQEDSKQ